MSENQSFFVKIRGRTLGPIDLPRLRQMIQQGQISRINPVSIGGQRWQKAEDFSQLFQTGVEQSRAVALPAVSRSPRPSRALLSAKNPGLASSNQKPHSIAQFILIITSIWAAICLISLVLYVLSAVFALFFAKVFAVLLFIAVTIPVGIAVLKVLFSKRLVLSDQKEVNLFFGMAKLISWDPTEGVLFLTNKSVSFVDDSLEDGGGIRLIYPVLGEEIICRVPLEVQTLSVHDEKVMTREYLPLAVHGTVKWRIVDLTRFYLLVSREIHVATDRGNPEIQAYLPNHPERSQISPVEKYSQHQRTSLITAARKLEAVEQWLRYVAEEHTRSVVSKLSTGLLVAERVAADLPPDMRAHVQGQLVNLSAEVPTSSDTYISTSDGLAGAIHDAMTLRVNEFGIDVHEVTLQEVRLPQHIHDAAVEACKAAYIPLIAQKRALGRKMELQAEADVIGAETVGAREVISNAPAFVLTDFLATYLARNQSLGDATKRQEISKQTRQGIAKEPPPKIQ